MSSDGWEYYNHSAVCKYAPHREADTDAIKNNTIWNLDGKKPTLSATQQILTAKRKHSGGIPYSTTV